MKIWKRYFDIELGILCLNICYKIIIANKTHSIILIITEKIDLDDKFRYIIIIFSQKPLKDVLRKELNKFVIKIDRNQKE